MPSDIYQLHIPSKGRFRLSALVQLDGGAVPLVIRFDRAVGKGSLDSRRKPGCDRLPIQEGRELRFESGEICIRDSPTGNFELNQSPIRLAIANRSCAHVRLPYLKAHLAYHDVKPLFHRNIPARCHSSRISRKGAMSGCESYSRMRYWSCSISRTRSIPGDRPNAIRTYICTILCCPVKS